MLQIEQRWIAGYVKSNTTYTKLLEIHETIHDHGRVSSAWYEEDLALAWAFGDEMSGLDLEAVGGDDAKNYWVAKFF